MTDLLSLLQECYSDRLAALLSHEAGARLVAQYDANNTYQYIINREEAHLSWLSKAIAELGGQVPESGETPDRSRAVHAAADWKAIPREDARAAQAFVDKWSPRVDAMTNARHSRMLRVILGEVLEEKRFFEQAAAGVEDLLGRRPDHVGPRVGEVLPTRWIE